MSTEFIKVQGSKDKPSTKPLRPTITFSYPHNWNNLTQHFVGSKDGLLIHEFQKPKRTRILGSLLNQGSCYVDMNRERIVVDFLNHSQDTHLLMIDPDISFEPNILEKFASLVLESPSAGIIAARVNVRNGLPVFYYQHPDGISLINWVQPFIGLKEFDFVGTGVILLSRPLLWDMYNKLGHAHMFSLMIEEGTNRKLGDDLSFCKRARSLGHKIYGIWDIHCAHHKDYPTPSRYPSAEEVRITKR